MGVCQSNENSKKEAIHTRMLISNPDTNAALFTEWTQWDIPLRTFDGIGVNLANVSSISLGLGNTTSPQVGGGLGHMFFDDIRLYRL